MPRAKGQRVHLTSFRRRGRDESRQRAPPGTEFCDFAWGDLVYENVRFSLYLPNPPLPGADRIAGNRSRHVCPQ